jgi:HSP20 family protein
VASPFGTLWDIRREVDQLLDGFGRINGETMSWSLPTEVRETADELQFAIELPGLRPEDIDLTVENNVLTISGEKKFEREEEKDDGEYRLFERRYGRFTRSFTVPATVDAGKVSASYESGVLSISLPKTEAAKPRRIAIGGTPVSKQVGSREK